MAGVITGVSRLDSLRREGEGANRDELGSDLRAGSGVLAAVRERLCCLSTSGRASKPSGGESLSSVVPAKLSVRLDRTATARSVLVWRLLLSLKWVLRRISGDSTAETKLDLEGFKDELLVTVELVSRVVLDFRKSRSESRHNLSLPTASTKVHPISHFLLSHLLPRLPLLPLHLLPHRSSADLALACFLLGGTSSCPVFRFSLPNVASSEVVVCELTELEWLDLASPAVVDLTSKFHDTTALCLLFGVLSKTLC